MAPDQGCRFGNPSPCKSHGHSCSCKHIDFETRSPTELGTEVHKYLSDHHIVEFPVPDDVKKVLDEMREAIVRLDAQRDMVVLVMGGDLMHVPGAHFGQPDILVDNGDIYEIDYKTIEERVLQHIASTQLEAYCRGAVELDKRMDAVLKPVVKQYAEDKPIRGGGRRDWEQRNRKQRRR